MSAPNYYIIDFLVQAINLFLTELRQPIVLRFKEAIMPEFQSLHDSFLAYRESNLYKIEHTGQVWSMEKVLNDAFDNDLRRIYIEDGVLVQPPFIYRRAEERPTYIFRRNENQPFYLRRRAEIEDSDKDFIIYVPIVLQPENVTDDLTFLAAITKLADYYKIASKTYRIEYYE